MNHYLIDGYNLLFFLRLDDKSLEAERDLLIEALLLHIKEVSSFFTIVFDAYLQLSPLSRRHIENLEIIFTEEKKTADDWIIEEVASKKKGISFIVASNDKKLCSLARSEGARTVTIPLFIEQLLRFQKKKVQVKKRDNPSLVSPEKPKEKKIVVGSVDYYLKMFEKESPVKDFEQHVVEKPKIKEKKAVDPKRLNESDDFERWLFLFESE